MKASFPAHTSAPQQGMAFTMLGCVCVYECVCIAKEGGHFSALGSNTNYSTIWWLAPSQSPLTLLPEETCCAMALRSDTSFICTSTHTHAPVHVHFCVCVCVRVCNRWEWQGIVRGGSAEMCSPMRSFYPPVLTPLGGRPPGNKSRLSDTLHHSTHTLSVVNKKIGGEKRRGVQRRRGKNGEGEREMGGAGWS